MSHKWPAKRSVGGEAALWVAGGLLVLAVALLVLVGSGEPGPLIILLAILAALLAAMGTVLLAWAIAYRRLAYSLTDGGLHIDWLGQTVVVPYPAIQGIYTGQRLAGHATPGVPRWPGISVGPARVRGLGRLRFFATSADQSELTFITVEHGGVIVSARDPHEFQAALIERVEQYQGSGVRDNAAIWHHIPPTAAPWTAFADVWLPLSGAVGTLMLLLVLAAIAIQFGALPDQIPLHFDAAGRANQVGPKSDLLRLPFFGLIILAINWALGVWLHPREPLLARLLWIGGAIVQGVLFLGVLRLLA